MLPDDPLQDECSATSLFAQRGAWLDRSLEENALRRLLFPPPPPQSSPQNVGSLRYISYRVRPRVWGLIRLQLPRLHWRPQSRHSLPGFFGTLLTLLNLQLSSGSRA